MTSPMPFNNSAPLTMGVELELQLVDLRDGNLTHAAADLLRLVKMRRPELDVKLEITESMIEVASGVQSNHAGLLHDLRNLRDVVCEAAQRLNVGVCGGGAHPFQHWAERRIAQGQRFQHISGLYGYLAKQFTVFGQHVHIGCPDGDSAVRLLHGLGPYVPHFIALAANSPFLQGTDTQFDCARMNTVSAFPLAGRMPFVTSWEEFSNYYDKMLTAGVIESMKDFYWDIRPKPEYGTIEIRVCDTPVTVERAAALAAYAQALARYLLVERPHTLSEDAYHVYSYNRFQACRFGLEGEFADPHTQEKRSLREDIVATLEALAVHAHELDAEAGLEEIADCVRNGGNDARWMREVYAKSHSLPDLVWRQAERWRGEGK